MIRDHHMLLHEGHWFIKFPCPISDSPQRKEFEAAILNTPPIKMNWQQGASFNIAVCSYLTQGSLLIQFRRIAYFEIFWESSAQLLS